MGSALETIAGRTPIDILQKALTAAHSAKDYAKTDLREASESVEHSKQSIEDAKTRIAELTGAIIALGGTVGG